MDAKEMIEAVVSGDTDIESVTEADRGRMPKNESAIMAATALKSLAGELKGIKRSELAWKLSELVDKGVIAPKDVKGCYETVQALRFQASKLR